jgi:hypothetical protein
MLLLFDHSNQTIQAILEATGGWFHGLGSLGQFPTLYAAPPAGASTAQGHTL